MKKVLVALALLLIAGVGLLYGLKSGGFDLGKVGFGTSDRSVVQGLTYGFLEDLQYKDFPKASRYHTWPDQQKADIPKLIERLFAVKPEQLNIRNVQVTKVDFDSDGQRARAFFKATNEVLNSSQNPDEQPNEERRVEGILYWHRGAADLALPPADAKADDPKVKAFDPSQVVLPALGPEGQQYRWYMKLESSLH